MHQFPHAFEFNLEFLNFISSHIYSCLYGTFIFSSDKEREEYDAYNRTVSIWSHVFHTQNKKNFLNPFFKANVVQEINPYYSLYKLRLWEEFFFRYDLKENIIKINANDIMIKDKDDSDKIDCENSKCERNDNIIIKDYYKYYEINKKNDLELIKQQHEKIFSLTNIIKDMASVANSHHLIDVLSPTSKEYIYKLDEIQININNFESNSNNNPTNPTLDATEKLNYDPISLNNKINLMENYINNKGNK